MERIMRILRIVYLAVVPAHAVVLTALFGWPGDQPRFFPAIPLTLPLVILSMIAAVSSRFVRP
jgi:hypothetical protein